MSNRNNLNRLGGPTPEDSGSAAIVPEQTNTMQYAMPTDIVDLPSKRGTPFVWKRLCRD